MPRLAAKFSTCSIQQIQVGDRAATTLALLSVGTSSTVGSPISIRSRVSTFSNVSTGQNMAICYVFQAGCNGQRGEELTQNNCNTIAERNPFEAQTAREFGSSEDTDLCTVRTIMGLAKASVGDAFRGITTIASR